MSTSERTQISSLNKSKEDYIYKVSIIVPCYNTKPWLDECLQSLVDQTLQEIEIICVNDGSTDGTGSRLDEWQAQYPNKIKVIHQQNGGLSNARNAGMVRAQGKCIGFVDSDDFVNISMYEKLYQVLKDNHADSVRCNFLCFNDGEHIKSTIDSISPIKIKSLKEDLHKTLFSFSHFFTCGYIHKKTFLDNNNIQFQPNIRYMEDLIFAYDVAICSPNVFKIKDKFYFYRNQRIGKLTSLNGKDVYNSFKAFECIHNKIANNKLDSLKSIHKMLIKVQISLFCVCINQIQNKYKKYFLFKASNFIFKKNNTNDIYKSVLFTRYRNPINYLLAPIVVVLFHCCYLWQKISVKNIKNYFMNKFN